ncbi:hypothetical protein [Xanthomonas maliensis]|uniref:hypothetical protein n=1 Tax=Xanthomonas maliensis TaxID=1321368 RepID=UPI0012DE6CC4|nr:hypothetical protein [Xanthomonas maliensis]
MRFGTERLQRIDRVVNQQHTRHARIGACLDLTARLDDLLSDVPSDGSRPDACWGNSPCTLDLLDLNRHCGAAKHHCIIRRLGRRFSDSPAIEPVLRAEGLKQSL